MINAVASAAFMAAGTAFDFWQQGIADRMARLGHDLDTANMNANLERLRLQSAQESLQDQVSLRQSVGTQIAANAARGVASYTPGQIAKVNRQEGQLERGEQFRRMNLLAKESQLRAANVLSGLQTWQSETQAGRKIVNRVFDNLPILFGGQAIQEAGDAAFNAFDGGLGPESFGGA